LCLVPSSSGEATIGTLRRPSVLSLLKLISFSPQIKPSPLPANSTRLSRAASSSAPADPTHTHLPARPALPSSPHPQPSSPHPQPRSSPVRAPDPRLRTRSHTSSSSRRTPVRAVHQYAPYTSTRAHSRLRTIPHARSHTHDPTPVRALTPLTTLEYPVCSTGPTHRQLPPTYSYLTLAAILIPYAR